MSVTNGSLQFLLRGGAYKPRVDAKRHCVVQKPTICRRCIKYQEGPYEFNDRGNVSNPAFFYDHPDNLTDRQKLILKKYDGPYTREDLENLLYRREKPRERDEKDERQQFGDYEEEVHEPLPYPIENVVRGEERPFHSFRSIPRGQRSVRFDDVPYVRYFFSKEGADYAARHSGNGLCKKCRTLRQ